MLLSSSFSGLKEPIGIGRCCYLGSVFFFFFVNEPLISLMEWTFLNLRGAGQRFRRVAPSRVRALDIKMDHLRKAVTPMVRSVSTSTVSVRRVKVVSGDG